MRRSQETGNIHKGRSDYGAILLYGLMLTGVLMLAYFTPRGDADVAILVSPFASHAAAANAVAQADGRIVDTARWPFIVMARPAADNTNFVARLYKAGALVVFSPGVMAGCLKKE